MKIHKIFPVLILFFICFIFFLKLFLPHLSLIVTPDFGQSDIVNGYYPIKFFLSETLKVNKFPFWSELTAMGYPIYADGQIGTFVLANLILFKFLPFVLAINFGYVLIFFIAGLGTYLYCREIDVEKWSSLFAGIIFAFSGFNIGQISHISLVQAASFMPMELFFIERILKKIKLTDILLFSLILSQQVFSGHQQMTIYSLIAAAAYILFRLISKITTYKSFFKGTVYITLGILFGIMMSSALILPSFELFKISGGRGNVDVLSQFPYPPSNLLTFLNPFYFGNPARGTYPVYGPNWGIFWENNGYVGLLPLVFLVFSLFFLTNKKIRLWLLLLLFSVLMILGKYSPLYFLYNFFPLNLFRVPSRFLLLTDFSLAVISAIVVSQLAEKIRNKKAIFFIGSLVISIQFVNIFYYFYNYHPIESVKSFFSKSDVVTYLDEKKNPGRLLIVDNYESWNNIFLKTGWQDIGSYEKFKSGIIGHSNLFFNISKANFYATFPTKRMNLVNSLMAINPLTTSSAKILSLNNISYILVPKTISIKNLPLERKFEDYSLYKNPNSLPRARILYNFKQINSIQDLSNYIDSGEFDPQKTALVETKLPFFQTKSSINFNKIKWQYSDSEKQILKVVTFNPGIFVLADSYYPGWKAYVDGKEKTIFPININQRGVIIDKGEHTIEFVYSPFSIKLGFLITFTSYLLVALFLGRKIWTNLLRN